MFLSIIIPVYNGEKYIRKCLDSIIAQASMELEIILVDDGSKDESLNIIKEYAKEQPYIKYIVQKNKGAAAARNAGLDKAVGQFIMFMDCDDWLEEGSLVELCSKLENDLDMLVFSWKQVGEKHTSEHKQYNKRYNTGREYFYDVIIGNVKGAFTQNWHIYSRDFLERNNLRYDENHRRGQDAILNAACMKYLNKVLTTDIFGYNWRVDNTESLTYNISSNFCDSVAYRQELTEQLIPFYGLNDDELIREKFYEQYYSAFLMVLTIIKSARISFKQKNAFYKECLQKNMTCEAIEVVLKHSIKKGILVFAVKKQSIFALYVWRILDIQYIKGVIMAFFAIKLFPRNTKRGSYLRKLLKIN